MNKNEKKSISNKLKIWYGNTRFQIFVLHNLCKSNISIIQMNYLYRVLLKN